MIHPDSYPAAMPLKLRYAAFGMFPFRRQFAVRMQAIDMSGLNQGPHHLATRIIRSPVGELMRGHVEINRIADFQTNPRTH
jgi:hypothetical protein